MKHTHYDAAEQKALLNSPIPVAIMASAGTHFDSAEDASIFFARELDHVKSKSYDKQYPQFTALTLFPQTSDADAGAETITCYTYDKDDDVIEYTCSYTRGDKCSFTVHNRS